MSRIGKKPIIIPEGVEIKLDKNVLKTKGPKGELNLEILPDIKLEINEKEIIVSLKRETKDNRAFWGLTRALIANNIEGITMGFKKQLEIQGLGYKAETNDKGIILNVGFSHLVELAKPEGIDIIVENKIITVSGINKQLVGQVAAEIRKVRPPEPYKGKGIRYLGEIVRRKVGKKAAATG